MLVLDINLIIKKIAYLVKTNKKIERNEGNLYKLELSHPDPAKEKATPLSPNDFLHWDLPLSHQPEKVRQFASKNLKENFVRAQTAAKKIGIEFNPNNVPVPLVVEFAGTSTSLVKDEPLP